MCFYSLKWYLALHCEHACWGSHHLSTIRSCLLASVGLTRVNIELMLGQWVQCQGVRTRLRKDWFGGRRNFSALSQSNETEAQLPGENPLAEDPEEAEEWWLWGHPGLSGLLASGLQMGRPRLEAPWASAVGAEPCGEQWTSFSKTSSSLALN